MKYLSEYHEKIRSGIKKHLVYENTIHKKLLRWLYAIEYLCDLLTQEIRAKVKTFILHLI